jgi:hypothetical protein
VQMGTNALTDSDSTPASYGRVSIRFSKPESHSVGFADRIVFCVVKVRVSGLPREGAQDAIPLPPNGTCPHGWTRSGSYCLRSGSRD